MKKTKYILISTLLFLLLTGCGRDNTDTGTNSTNQNNNGTNAVEDMGDGIIDGVEDAGEGIIDGAEDIGEGVKDSMDNMTGKNDNNNSTNSNK